MPACSQSLVAVVGLRWLRAPAVLLAAGLLAVPSVPAPARAQAAPQRGSLRGVVRSTLGDRIPYAVVALEPAFPHRFTDDSGNFVFPRVPPGTYHFLARQVGYKPLDTTVVVLPDSTLELRIALEHLVVELSQIDVTAELARAARPSHCTEPGPPDPVRTADLAAIFVQLKQNAERYWMLADSYPAIYRMSRSRGYMDRDGKVFYTSVDTVELRTDTRWHYAPGHLLADLQSPHGGTELQVMLPTLPDLADSVFDANHCFRLVGLDTLEGEMYVRVDFRPDERLVEPDADGSAYLDPVTYLIRYLKIQLTHASRAVVDLVNLTAKVRFREIAPSIVIADLITSEAASRQGAGLRGELVEGRELQRLLSVFFTRPLPRREAPGP
jgi:hypothetical protein